MEAFFGVRKLEDVGMQAEQAWPTEGSVGLGGAGAPELNPDSCFLLTLQMPCAPFPTTMT